MQQQPTDGRDGVLVADGYGLKVYVERGHLIVHYGVGRQRETRRFNRATGGLKRLVVLGHTGFVTLEALRWLRDIDASFVQIDTDGQVITATASKTNQDAWRRRAQALAPESPAGLDIMRALISAKIHGQAHVVQRISHLRPLVARKGARGRTTPVAEVIADLGTDAVSAPDLKTVGDLERLAARHYWATWAPMPVTYSSWWEKRLPEHWATAGNRTNSTQQKSSPRNALTPVHAMLNYTYSILESQTLIAIQEYGLDPSLPIAHATSRHRHNLVADVMEAARPAADAIVLDALAEQPLDRGDVYETRDGTCRLGRQMAARLAERALDLHEAVSPHCFTVVQRLLEGQGIQQTRGRRVGRRRTAERLLA